MPPNFFKKVFSFAEGTYDETKAALLSIATFSAGCWGRERCVFSPQRINTRGGGGGGSSLIDAGSFYFPSVRDLRVEVDATLAAFEREFPGYLDQLHHKYSTRCAATIVAQGNPGGEHTLKDLYKRLVSHVIGDAKELHAKYPNAVIQAASQFNLLEFPAPAVVPEHGITAYVHDPTQGPACAVSCAAGTAYRNYLVSRQFASPAGSDRSAQTKGDVEVDYNGERGQTSSFQLNGLGDVTNTIVHGFVHGTPADGSSSNNTPKDETSYYTVHNGYFFSSNTRMEALTSRIEQIAACAGITREAALSELASLVRIGVQEETDVTLGSDLASTPTNREAEVPVHKVTQTYNSALSIAYTGATNKTAWETFATTVLTGGYEGTFLVGVLATLRHLRALNAGKSPESYVLVHSEEAPLFPPIFLTKVGGGVFGNEAKWIRHAIEESLLNLSGTNGGKVPLDVRLVHFRSVEQAYV